MDDVDDGSTFRAGTFSVTLPAALSQSALRDAVRDALAADLAMTDEHLAAYDFGPPRRSPTSGMRAYDVMFRTGPPQDEQTGPNVRDDPPQVSA